MNTIISNLEVPPYDTTTTLSDEREGRKQGKKDFRRQYSKHPDLRHMILPYLGMYEGFQ